MTDFTSYSIVFPGQGSQFIGMLNEFYLKHDVVKEIFNEAADALGYDLWDIVVNGPEETLNKTETTQPALLSAGYAVWKVWIEQMTQPPSMLAGHSLGEYTALVAADVIVFTDAVKLVAERGLCMQHAVAEGEGAMAAILGLGDAQVDEICNNLNKEHVVAAANYNSPGQVVIAGHRQMVDAAIGQAKAAGARRALMLPVSAPSHCILMKPAAEKFAESLNAIDIHDANIPIVQNVDAISRTRAVEIKSALLAQFYKPVRWVDVINTLKQHSGNAVIECGPGKVLTGLNRCIDKTLTVSCIQDPDSLNKTLETNTDGQAIL